MDTKEDETQRAMEDWIRTNLSVVEVETEFIPRSVVLPAHGGYGEEQALTGMGGYRTDPSQTVG